MSWPVHGGIATFGTGRSTIEADGRALDYRYRVGARTFWRIGYDLFREIRLLLTDGQPAMYASTPTLELHVELLRRLILHSGIPILAIPARPHGYDFTCCLTHDLDFAGVRRHKLDRTLAGFIARASVGTLADLVRGRRSPAEAGRNWGALLSLPLVYLGLAPDLWRPFDDYARVEDPRRSTFFLVPFKGRPGVSPTGSLEAARAVRYQASEVRGEASEAASRGSELAVHGIDAWRDPAAGRAELNQVTVLAGRQTAGVRMHWLYFDADSPRWLEAAGFEYDSTWGYNDAVGFRAGTAQAFRLPASQGLMELPMSIMDSALFSHRRMGLAPDEAFRRCLLIVHGTKRFGGALVINWHDRSLAPERLWGRFYRELLEYIRRDNRVWFATAREAVDWFRWRRSIRFGWEADLETVTVAGPSPTTDLPAGTILVCRPRQGREVAVEQLRFDGDQSVRVPARP